MKDKPWDERSWLDKNVGVRLWLFWRAFGTGFPVRSDDGAYAWHAAPRAWSWWLLTPYFVRRWWVRRENARHCATVGHEDMLWHFHEGGPIEFGDGRTMPPPDPVCSNCSAILTACTGVGHHHKAAAPAPTPSQREGD